MTSPGQKARRARSSPPSSETADASELSQTRDLLIEALIGGGKAGAPQTLRLAQTNLESTRRAGTANSSDVANALHNLADVHFQRGEFALALMLHEEGLAIRADLVPPDAQVLADSLERLATTQMRMERYDVARQNLERATVIRVTRSGDEPLRLARTQELVAWLHRYAGNYDAAREPLEAALATLRRLVPDHPALITAIEVQGDLQMLQGEISSGVRSWKEALALAERTVGSQHPIVSALERRLSSSANALGNRAEARQRLERGLLIAERTRAECDPELIGLVNSSAGSLVIDGEYVEARRRFIRTLELSERCLGTNNSNTATAVFNLAALTAQMGDLMEAQRLYERSIQAWSARGSADSFVAKGVDALAEVLEAAGDLARARELFDRALTIRRDMRADHPDVAWTLTNLARVLALSGDVSLALRYLSEATDIYRRNGTSIEPDHLARTISLRGDIQARRGNYLMARVDFAEALALRERLFGSEHPLAAESRLKVATADLVLERYDDAVAAARRARESGLDHVKFTVRYLPERRALAYASRTTQGLGLELSLATITPSAAPSQFLDAVIRSRSLVLDELGARAHALNDPDPQVAAMQARLNAARQRFANLMLRSMGEGGSLPDTTGLLNSARHEREEAEQALAEQSAAFQSLLERSDVGLAHVRARVLPGSALVSFVRYDRTIVSAVRRAPPERSTKTATVVPSYLAFVLRHGDPEPRIVLLGVASEIDDLVTNWRRQMIAEIAGAGGRTAAGPSLKVLGERLRKRLWDSVSAHISGIDRVFVVPDGALNLFPIGALPTDRGTYLVEERPVIHYLSTERDVVRSGELPSGSSGLLAIGGPAFADVSSFGTLSGSKSQRVEPTTPLSGAMALGPARQSLRGSDGCPSYQSISFGPLPASSIEAESIGKLWNQISTSSGPGQAQVLTGPLATEGAFKGLSSKRRILHLATHGFFLGEDCGPEVEGTRAVGGLTVKSPSNELTGDVPRRPTSALENPLLFSGLALAGANRRASASLDEDDGILTAEEVAALNLDGVEWAVLSACNTGLGAVAAGEGVLGLRRAFQVAGVRTVIMSLWSVEDQAARQWMEALYRARLVDRLDTADSVRHASLTVLRERRAKGQSTHPFYWASFVAAGDWR